MTRCKFVCQSRTQTKNWNDSGNPFLYDFRFSAVTMGSKENDQFWKWTPSGTVELRTIREDAFIVGKEYYLDFAEAMPVQEETKA